MATTVNLAGMDRQSERDMIDMLIATGALTVTRCDEHVRRTFRSKLGGGALPGHLDPRVLS